MYLSLWVERARLLTTKHIIERGVVTCNQPSNHPSFLWVCVRFIHFSSHCFRPFTHNRVAYRGRNVCTCVYLCVVPSIQSYKRTHKTYYSGRQNSVKHILFSLDSSTRVQFFNGVWECQCTQALVCAQTDAKGNLVQAKASPMYRIDGIGSASSSLIHSFLLCICGTFRWW